MGRKILLLSVYCILECTAQGNRGREVLLCRKCITTRWIRRIRSLQSRGYESPRAWPQPQAGLDARTTAAACHLGLGSTMSHHMWANLPVPWRDASPFVVSPRSRCARSLCRAWARLARGMRIRWTAGCPDLNCVSPPASGEWTWTQSETLRPRQPRAAAACRFRRLRPQRW